MEKIFAMVEAPEEEKKSECWDFLPSL